MDVLRSLKSITSPVSLNTTRAQVGLAVLYVALIFILPADKMTFSNYRLTAVEYRVLLFMVTLPLFVAWLAAYYGYITLRAYARSITRSPENVDFERLAYGCGWLVWSLPVPSIVGLILNAIGSAHPGFHPAATIIINYVNLLMLLVAFTVIGGAARGLISRTKVRFSLASSRLGLLTLVIGTVLYCYLSFRRLGASGFGASHNPYYLPVWIWLVTVTIPYLYAWYVGLLAAYEINIFSAHVRGLLYRRPLRLLAAGLMVVIVSFVALQYVNSIASRSGHLLLNYKLVLVSCFRLLATLGYALIAMGALRLRKIEEV